MGNLQILKNRCSSIATAALSTVSLFLTIGSVATCSFVQVFAEKNVHVGSYYTADTYGGKFDRFYIGIFCTAKSSTSGNTMLKIGRIFIVVALFLSAFLSVVFWSIALFMKASDCLWKALTILTAIAAFLQIPAFLIFDGITCKQYDCHLAEGAYTLISAIICMVCCTMITQLCDVPDWIQTRDAWKLDERRFDFVFADGHSRGSDDDYCHILSTLSSRRKTQINPLSFFLSIFFSGPPRHVAMTDDSPDHDDDEYPRINDTNSPDEYLRVQSFDNMMKGNASFYAVCDNSRLLLHVTPNGRQIGDDDRQSEWSFANSLEEDIRIAEMEKGLPDRDSNFNIHSRSVASDQNDRSSVSSRTSLNSERSDPAIPLQFLPSAHDVSSLDSKRLVNEETKHLDQQPLLDREELVSGVHGLACEASSSWETFEDVNDFQKAVDKGENAANITNQTEDDCTISTCTPDDVSDVVDDSETYNSPFDIEENTKVIVGVQQLNRATRKESKNRRKMTKSRSSSSLCSKRSLLDLTIDEETQDDLQLEDTSGDENRSTRSGVRYKSTASSSSMDAYEQGYLSRNHSSHEDTLAAGLRLVSSVLSKMKDNI